MPALATMLALSPSLALAKGQADFNGDGLADLAIGAPSKNVGAVNSAGAVVVVMGTANGPHGVAKEWNQNTPGMPGVAEAGDLFGSCLAWGDIDNDGYDDLVIASKWESGANYNEGWVHILYGSAAGLTTTGAQFFSSAMFDGAPTAAGEFFGQAMAVGDFNGDGYDDVGFGAPGHPGSTPPRNGIAYVGYGSAAGLVDGGLDTFTPASVGLTDQADQQFGSALATGDFNGDGRDDLAIGAPGRDHSSTNAGSVIVLYGSASGLTTAGLQTIQQNNGPGADAFEYFGFSLTSGDFNGNGKDDLAIGAIGQDVDGVNAAGAVTVIPGAAAGLAIGKAKSWHQNSAPGGVEIKDSAEEDDRFGEVLATGDVNGDGRDDLIVGVPYEDVKNENGIATDADSGQIHVILGSSTGLIALGNKKYSQASGGLTQPVSAPNDQFGATITTGNYNGDAYDDICIGVPFKDLGQTDEGAVLTMDGGSKGLVKATHSFDEQSDFGLTDGGRLGGGLYGQ